MKRLAMTVGATGLLLAGGLTQVAGAQPADCIVTVCGTEHGDVVTECVTPEVTNPGEVMEGGAAQIMLDPGVCKELEGKMPCDEIPDCKILFAKRAAPALGHSVLLFSALTLTVAGAARLRRKSRI
jgi:hypothetical protein